MIIIELGLQEITPYDNNPRQNDETVQKLAESIQEFGFLQPIVLDKHNIIVVGDTRYKAAKLIGKETVPVIIADHLTDEQAAAYRIADNKIAETSEWDLDKLEEEFEKFQSIKSEWWDQQLVDVVGNHYTEESFEDSNDIDELPDNKKGKKNSSDTATNKRIDLLVFGKTKIPLTETESQNLESYIQEYLNRTSSLYGFVEYLLRDI